MKLVWYMKLVGCTAGAKAGLTGLGGHETMPKTVQIRVEARPGIQL